MDNSDKPFYVVLGSVASESVATKLAAIGKRYVVKRLNSAPSNWSTIIDLLRNSSASGAVVKLTGADYNTLLAPDYEAVGGGLLASLGELPHIVLVHEEVVGQSSAFATAEDDSPVSERYWTIEEAQEIFGAVPPKTRAAVQELFDLHDIKVAVYRTNAEAALLAVSFLEDTVTDLLFRLYVPAGRLFEAEIARLLEMFHEWLGAVKRQSVRQTGYKTVNGQVIEFYGEGDHGRDLQSELEEFTEFLNLLGDTDAATTMLVKLGLPPSRARELVGRYAREARRVQLDVKHQRSQRVLSIQQQLESELVDEIPHLGIEQIGDLVEQLVPTSPFSGNMALTQASGPSPGPSTSYVFAEQYIVHAEGVVANKIDGPVSIGTSTAELIALVREFQGGDSEVLEIAAREATDEGAPAGARLRARQLLVAFLRRNAGRIEEAAFKSAWAILEQRTGA